MADVTRRARPSVDAATAMYAGQISGLIAAEDIAEGDFTIINGAGKLARTTSATGVFAGIAPRAAKAGEPLTVYNVGTRVGYATGLTPGASLFLSATAGRLADTGTGTPVAIAISATDIFITRAA